MNGIIAGATLGLLISFPSSGQPSTFVNPIAEGADPWVVKDGDRYVWCFSEGNRGISVWLSDRLTSIGTRHVVWQAPDSGPFAKEVWAPEMHRLDGKWYIYFAASDGRNENHLAYALESKDGDPLGPYQLHGPFATGDGKDGSSPNLWAIDMTVLEHGGKRYALWSGWDAPGTDRQFLYIAPMASPLTLAAPRRLLADNATHLWERTDGNADSRGLNEGPQVLKRGDRSFVTYSCGASWKDTYKLGLLELTGADPLDPAAWTKHPEPVFKSGGATIGVGHSTFVPSPDSSELWHVFHAKVDARDGWRRAVFLQPVNFKPDGFPDFGTPVQARSPQRFPKGQESPSPALPLDFRLKDRSDLRHFSYYGHQQFLAADADGVRLGATPAHPVNEYRSGEKLVLDGGDFDDIDAIVNLEFIEGDRDAGLLFRVSRPAVGFDAQSGYFAGVIPREKRVILGKTNGKQWREIARADFDPPPGKKAPLLLRVRAVGDRITVQLNGRQVLDAFDRDHARGSIGLRVVDTHVRFTGLMVAAVEQ
jgi:GH43 family beta-xylosidase